MSTLNFSNIAGDNFVLKSQATYVNDTTFTIPYNNNFVNGDAIAVMFPTTFPSNGTLNSLQIRNLSNNLTTGIKAFVYVVLIYNTTSWIVQGINTTNSIVDFEYDSAGYDAVPLNNRTWYSTTSQYVFRGNTTAPTLNDFTEYVDRTYHGRQNGETMKIDVTITGGVYDRNKIGSNCLIHQLRTIRSVTSTSKRAVTHLTSNQEDALAKIRGFVQTVSLSQTYSGVQLNEPIRVLLGGFGGSSPNRSQSTTNILQNFYIVKYSLLISHFYA